MPTTLSRRTFLYGAGGAVLAIPFLKSALSRRGRAEAADLTAPKRFFVWAAPDGTVTDSWLCQPADSPENLVLSEILQPLEAHKADLLILQNLMQYGGHAHHSCASLTGRTIVDNGFPALYATGISIDQYLANKWREQTPIPSLHLAVANIQNQETASCVSWAGENQPVPPENSPFAVFARLFAGGATDGRADELRRLLLERRSIIDATVSQLGSLEQQVGTSDRAVLDNYLTSLREVEQQLADLESSFERCGQPTFPAEPPPSGETPWWLMQENLPEVMNLHLDLATIAFKCDLTRVITLNLSNDGGAYRSFPYIPEAPSGVDWHGISHMCDTGETGPLVAVERWVYGQLAGLIERWKGVPETDGTSLLHSSLILTSNEYGPNGPIASLPPPPDGGARPNFSHYSRMMPYLLIGQAGGALRTGRCLSFPFREGDQQSWTAEGLHHTKLLVSILNTLGIPDTSFGDAEADQGPLPGV